MRNGQFVDNNTVQTINNTTKLINNTDYTITSGVLRN